MISKTIWYSALLGVPLFGALLCNPSFLRADDAHGVHGAGHDALHNWYLTLKQPGTAASCCNNQDCRPTQTRIVGGGLQVEIDGEWTAVPQGKILNTPSPDLQSHVCAPKAGYIYPKGHIFCVVMGSGA